MINIFGVSKLGDSRDYQLVVEKEITRLSQMIVFCNRAEFIYVY